METIQLATANNKKINRSVKALTSQEIEQTPEWIIDLCNYWLQVISRISKKNKAFDFYNKKVTDLLTVIRPVCIMGPDKWVNRNTSQHLLNLKNRIEEMIKIIKILSSGRNPVYLLALKELDNMLKKIMVTI
jgi:hypothetical protein